MHRLAYDGKGNAVVKSAASAQAAAADLGGFDHGLYAEQWAPYVKVGVLIQTSFQIITETTTRHEGANVALHHLSESSRS